MSVCIHLTGNSALQVLHLEQPGIDLDILQIREKKIHGLKSALKKWLRVYTNGNVNYSTPKRERKAHDFSWFCA